MDVASSTTAFRLPARQASLIASTFSVDHRSRELDLETDLGLGRPTPSSPLGFTTDDSDGDGGAENGFSSLIDIGGLDQRLRRSGEKLDRRSSTLRC